MKKVFSLLLVICMLVSALPYTGAAITYDKFDTVFTAFTPLNFEHSVTAKIQKSTEKNGSVPYFHYVAEPGEYTNTDLIIKLKAKNIKPDEYPIIKVEYKTNSPSSILDVSMTSPKGENWLSKHPALNSDDQWNSVTFNYNDITAAGTQYIPNKGESNITFCFKPFGSQKVTLDKQYYFDLHYVGFFKTEEEAASFKGFNMNTASYKYPVVTPEALFNNFAGGNEVNSINYFKVDDTSSFVRFTVEPGTYGNNLLISFTHSAFPIVERPYIKLAYKTDSKASKLDISMTSDKGENWPAGSKKPSLVGTGELTELIFTINDFTAANGVEAPDENSYVNIRLKPWGAQSVTITEHSYFDLYYVAFFETEEEARSFSYPGDDNYTHDYSQELSAVDYSFASKATVRDYIDDADARINEVIHTTNTVPYMQHLTLTGLTGAYGSSDEKDNKTFYTMTIPKGKHEAGALKFAFTQNDVALSSYPFIKLSYKSEVSSTALATLKSSNGSASLEFPISTSTNTYTQKLFDLSDFANYQSILQGSNVTFEVYPLGNNAKTLISSRSLTLEYIGLFKTRSAASNFVYAGEHGANMTSNTIIYTAKLLDPARIPSGRKVFVAQNGSSSSSNDGSNINNPISFARFRSINSSLPQGTVVFFKRGDSFRYDGLVYAHGYVTYTSYGVGDKPKFIASIDGTGASKWTKTEHKDVWVFNQSLKTLDNDVGHIRINDGELWGIKVSAKNYTDNRVNNGAVFNGRTHIEGMNGTLENGKGLVNDLEFWHDYDNGKLYLNCADGNPGEVFDSFEIANKGNAISGYSNTTVDNIYITGCGSHGIGMGTVNNVTLSNLHLEWIGGSIQTLALNATPTEGGTPTRFGNALEAYGGAVNVTMKNSFCDQVYDCCYTVQNQGAVNFENVFMYDNVARYSNSGLEVWQSGGTTTNMLLYDNYTLFGGYGWSHQRPNKDGNFFYGGLGIRTTVFTQNSVHNNVNILASAVALQVSEIASTRYNFNSNVYIMGENKIYSRAPVNPEGSGATSSHTYNYTSISASQSKGTDLNSKFLFIPTDQFNIGDDPYEIFKAGNNPIYDIEPNVDEIVLGVGDKFNISSKVYPESAENKELYYSSDHPLVASVNQEGQITANCSGSTTIKLISVESGVTAKIKVSVINVADRPSIWSKDTAGKDSYTANVLFVGDDFFSGEHNLPSLFNESFYVNTETIAQNGMSFTSNTYSVADALADTKSNSAVTFISAGYNDYLAGASLAEFEASLKETFSKARSTQSKSTIVYVTPLNLTKAKNSQGLTIGDYVESAKRIAATQLIRVADIYTNPKKPFTTFDNNGDPAYIYSTLISTDLSFTEKGVDRYLTNIIAEIRENALIYVYGIVEYAHTFTADMLIGDVIHTTHFLAPEPVAEAGNSYIRMKPAYVLTGADGTSFDIKFVNSSLPIKEYPIIRIDYRSNISSANAKLDLNMGVIYSSGNARLWGPNHSYNKNGELSTLIIDATKAFTGGDNISSLAQANDDSPVTYLRFKPYAGGQTNTDGDYFDIMSISFFKTVEDAEKGVADEEEEILVLRGDIDGNGVIETTDSVALSRYFAKWTGYTDIDEATADIDGNGLVETTDSVSFSRYFAKWTGYTDLFD